MSEDAQLAITNELLRELVLLVKPKPEIPSLLLVKKVTVATSGTPVQFPEGKVILNEIRLSTTGNTGDVYLADSPTTASSGVLRFGIKEDENIPLKVTDFFELSQLWLDADNNNDCVYIFCIVQKP